MSTPILILTNECGEFLFTTHSHSSISHKIPSNHRYAIVDDDHVSGTAAKEATVYSADAFYKCRTKVFKCLLHS